MNALSEELRRRAQRSVLLSSGHTPELLTCWRWISLVCREQESSAQLKDDWNVRFRAVEIRVASSAVDANALTQLSQRLHLLEEELSHV